ncbi:hypothetical protein C9994_10640 [Marivirga lumbricoides]|uniref:Pentapeptide repeat-containing protein n=1 Tax=Marivirga lumbricoides TaxID=1046115 RepID=A0A2T4DPP2_9BACT|nr:hypothetical protein C9994_10640 [Marivirga lumbricoides]
MEDSTEPYITSQEEFEKLIKYSSDIPGITADKIILPNSRTSYTFKDCNINFLKINIYHKGSHHNTKLINCHIDQVEININSDDGYLEIKGETRIGELLFQNSKFHRVKADEQVHLDVLKVIGGSVTLGNFQNLFPNKVRIKDTERAGGEIFGKDFYIENSGNYSNLTLVKQSRQTEKINIKRFTNLRLKLIDIKNDDLVINLDNCDNIEELIIQDSKISSLRVSHSQLKNCNLINVNIRNLELSKCYKLDLKIISTDKSKWSLISDFKWIEETSQESTIIIEKVNFSSLFFSNQIKFSELKLDQVKVSNTLDWQGLILNNASLKNVDLSQCNEILFLRSSLSQTTFTNIQWPSGNKIVKIKKLNLTESWQQREVYRQLKENHIKSSNSLDAKLFDRNELDVYLKLIAKKRGNNIFKGAYWEHIGDYLILASNKYFGGWGHNFWTPLIWLLIIHLFLFSILSSNYNFDFEPWIPVYNAFSWEATKEGLAAYLFFLNPLHRFIINGEVQYSVVDFFIRISSGYFIFYFLRATRKYH